ncbi:hypothetical protein ALC60_08209 [Trachymyrmex zeteki]|uniref:Uncharacterized protein n=1 Tax=Mycetomoellerius zeteki TaxID=64791 RepID=A0A151WY40_9HYME|nr:hypothetical protein ALC60_08209 [Trachymyrmex zeteki]
MPALTLYDDRSGNTYILEVSEEEFTKANKDMLFATRLLQKKLASQPQTVNEPVQTVHELEASTSSCDDNNIHTSTDNKTQQLSDVEEKGKRRSALEKMFEENTNIRKKMHEEAMARQDKLLDILSKVLQK